jgi:peptide/nickel transport system ATP-binding protein
MYAGRLAEIGPVRDVVKNASHPYTRGLMGSIPSLGVRTERLTQIDGAMPRLTAIPSGCAFNPRCPEAGQRCTVDRPDLMPAGVTRAACWLYDAGGVGPALAREAANA